MGTDVRAMGTDLDFLINDRIHRSGAGGSPRRTESPDVSRSTGVPPVHGYGAIDDGDKAGAGYSGASTGPHLCFAKLLHRARIMLGTMRVGS